MCQYGEGEERFGEDNLGILARRLPAHPAKNKNNEQIPTFRIFDVPKLLDIWWVVQFSILLHALSFIADDSHRPLLKSSPVLTQFSSSPLVLLGIEANKGLLGLSPSLSYAHLSPPFSLSTISSSPTSLDPLSDSSNFLVSATVEDDPLAVDSSAMQSLKDSQYEIIEGLLVLHVRRGDYETHCPLLASKGADWQGMVRLATQGMEDDLGMKSMVLHRPGLEGVREAEDNWKQTFQRRCFPSIDEMVLRVRQIRLEFPHLDRLYIMTNAKSDFLSSLTSKLLASSSSHVHPLTGQSLGPWKSIHHSRDLVLDAEQTYVAQAVDMAIGVRADLLLGNGWSSLTSHVVMMRMSRDVEARRSRMW